MPHIVPKISCVLAVIPQPWLLVLTAEQPDAQGDHRHVAQTLAPAMPGEGEKMAECSRRSGVAGYGFVVRSVGEFMSDRSTRSGDRVRSV